MAARPRQTAWTGMTAFAASLLIVLGAFNLVHGFSALFYNRIFELQPVFFDITTWGWVHVLVGALLGVVGYGLMQAWLWARIAAIGLVMLNMVTQMVALPAYPWWSLAIIVLDALILWALMAHGDERIA